VTSSAIQVHHLEYAKRVLLVTPELENRNPVGVQKVLANFLSEHTPSEATPAAMEKFIRDEEDWAKRPDPD
jgi:hypothetical protein